MSSVLNVSVSELYVCVYTENESVCLYLFDMSLSVYVKRLILYENYILYGG